MKKLLTFVFFLFCVTSSVLIFSVEGTDYVELDLAIQEQQCIAKKAIQLEESLLFFENKIEELEVQAKEYSEEFQAFKESFGVGILGALSVFISGDMRTAPLFIAAVLSGLNRVRCRSELHIISQLMGSALGAQLLLFFAGG